MFEYEDSHHCHKANGEKNDAAVEAFAVAGVAEEAAFGGFRRKSGSNNGGGRDSAQHASGAGGTEEVALMRFMPLSATNTQSVACGIWKAVDGHREILRKDLHIVWRDMGSGKRHGACLI